MISSLNRSMAFRAKAYEIAQIISGDVVMLELAPRCDVMHVKRSTYRLLSYTAFLASIVISFTGKVFLNIPVRTSPCTVSSLPVWMIAYSMPTTKAFKSTEDMTVNIQTVSTLEPALFQSHIFTASIARQCNPCISTFASLRAKLSIEMLIAMAIYSKWLLAILTNDLHRCFRYLSAFIRAITINSIVTMKQCTACLTSIFGMLLYSILTRAFARTILLRDATRNIANAAISAGSWCFVHVSIIAQENE